MSGHQAVSHQCGLPAWPDEGIHRCSECGAEYIASTFHDDEFNLTWWGWAPAA